MKGIDLRKEQGAVVVLVAVLMVVFILCIALVVDLGHLHNVKVQLQRAADAAALAGAGQLDSSADQDINATSVARATAALNKVDNKTGLASNTPPGWVDDVSVTVVLGTWDPDRTKTNRFTPDEAPTNAIKVTARLLVEHYFFFFPSGTEVVADAIAVNDYREQTIPLVVVSCIPTDDNDSILSPGTSVNDLVLLKFGAATVDTGAWSSLTINNANANNIGKFFDECGTRLFNKIVYGTTETHSGIENEAVKKSGGCSTDDNSIQVNDFNDLCNEPTNITCGMGADFTTGNPLNPLDFNPLPRWYNSAEFKRIWSMDDVLTRDFNNETADEYKERLGILYEASKKMTAEAFEEYNAQFSYRPTEFTDDRFTRFIDKKTPIYTKPLEEAGYPSVWLIEGKTNAIADFLKNVVPMEGNSIVGDNFKPNLVNDNEPFDEKNSGTSFGLGETIQLTTPVIFTGTCGEASYNSPAHYVGTANFLVTRVWNTINDCYDVGVNAVELQTGADYSRFGSDEKNSPLPALVANKILCTKGFDGKSLEGLVRLPSGDEDTETGIKRIFLVE